MAKILDDKSLQKEVHTNLGHVYYKSCIFDAALRSYLNAQKISNHVGDSQREANVCLMLGHTFRQLKQHEKAIEYYKKALSINEELNGEEMEKFLTEYQKNQAIEGIHSSDNLLNAKIYSQKALENAIDLASVACKEFDYETAREWYEKALDTFEIEDNDHNLKVKALIGLGVAWFNLGKNQKATETIRRAREFAEEETDAGIYLATNGKTLIVSEAHFLPNKVFHA
jgi:tetratricopeptide (TPR) repeat protein